MKVTAILSVTLALALVWALSALARVENERYALSVGMCRMAPPSQAADFNCLSKVQTRTSKLWHIYYALLGS